MMCMVGEIRLRPGVAGGEQLPEVLALPSMKIDCQ